MAAEHPQTGAPQERARDRAEWTWSASTAAVASARRQARTWLAAAGASTATMEAAVLVVSELVTNAIRASVSPESTIRLQIVRNADGWRITVADRGGGFLARGPSPPDQNALSIGGRGLTVVASLAGDVSVRQRAGWTAVSTVVPATVHDDGAITSEGSGR